MKFVRIIKSIFKFVIQGVKLVYQLEILKTANPNVIFGKGFYCNDISKFCAGKGSEFGDNVSINCGWSSWSNDTGFFKCGKNVYLGPNSVVFAAGGIKIHDDVLISPSVNLISHQHQYSGIKPYHKEKSKFSKVEILNNVWIGANATILPGVTIGENSIVAANAVVNRDVPKNVLVAGVPAKVIKQI